MQIHWSLRFLQSKQFAKTISEIIQDYREQKRKKEQAEAWEDEQKEKAEIMDKLGQDEKTI